MNQKQLELQRQQDKAINNRHKQTPQQIVERRKRQGFFLRQLNAAEALEDRGQIMIPKVEDISLGLLAKVEKDLRDKAKRIKDK